MSCTKPASMYSMCADRQGFDARLSAVQSAGQCFINQNEIQMKIFVATVIATASLFAQADPLAEFQSMVVGCKAEHAAIPPVNVSLSETKKEWVKVVKRVDNITYDVLKSDSLVSPFTAFIEITELLATSNAPTEEAAKAIELDIDGKAFRIITRIRFAYQDGYWKLIDGQMSGAQRSAKGESFKVGMSTPLGRDSFVKPGKVSTSPCFGPPKH